MFTTTFNNVLEVFNILHWLTFFIDWHINSDSGLTCRDIDRLSLWIMLPSYFNDCEVEHLTHLEGVKLILREHLYQLRVVFVFAPNWLKETVKTTSHTHGITAIFVHSNICGQQQSCQNSFSFENPFFSSLTSSYSYSSQNVSLMQLHGALIMKRVLTKPGKNNNSALNWIDLQPIRATQ